MTFSLSHGKEMDVTGYGFTQADLPPLPTQPDAIPIYQTGVFNLRSWFAPDRQHLPVEIEIGSGKGTFLVQHAQLVPNTNFLGIEYARAFWKYAADRLRRHQLANARLLHTEAGSFVRQYVADGSIQQYHIYFPDPWPKTRHNKRRLVQAPFLRQLHRTLQPSTSAVPACIRLATDHADYFSWMQEHAAQVEDLFVIEPFITSSSAGEGELVGTNFERKYRREGRPFFSMILRKR